ncbi:hypothetical protein [Proteus mirabilis]|uniref:hypothetical protein n=1 Tax=Proteus mirabilis TaxID=584 RepID=UPI0012EC50A0|nr:hypothetical protein [Proteus mirabilis]MVD51408.1 hypothetical protein [Proteus mirabilis]MVD73717.1 hypothetical protein [Proteus mirabilis]MVF42722.1 hypothetical protein [Proteus mirabilis]QKQ95229.1 hypothetical protein GCE56_06510 [Proteus mirabilis]UHD50894.1 hypothetical protein LUA10_06115 [Proteus mirabilis]
MIEKNNTEHKVNEHDDPLIKAIHHFDDGCCYIEPYLHDLNFRRFIHDGVYKPRPNPKQVTEPKLTPNIKKKKRKSKGVHHAEV